MRRLEDIAGELIDLEIEKRSLNARLKEVNKKKGDLEMEFRDLADMSDNPVASIKTADGWTVYNSLHWNFQPKDGDWDALCDRIESNPEWAHMVQRRINYNTLGAFGREFRDEIGDVQLPGELADVLEAKPYRRTGYRKG